MPAFEPFRKEARVASLAYQLGLDRLPEDETRSPRVLHGDPAVCGALEKASRLRNASTNYAVSWLELVPDRAIRETCCELVEEVFLVGLPRNWYVHTVIGHDENVSPEAAIKAAGWAKRSAGHGKIVNLMLPSGGHLQPIYPKREIPLAELYLALAAIRNGWASLLDPGRERNGHWLRRYPDIYQAIKVLEAKARNAERGPDGGPDARSILAAWSALGVDEVFLTTGPTGRRGISIVAEDHPKPIRFFGPEFEAVHDALAKSEITKNENERSTRKKREILFPGGYLVRDAEHTGRIEAELNRWLDRRADFNRVRYNVSRTAFVVGGLDRPRRIDPADRLEQLHGPAPDGERDVQAASGRSAARGEPDTQKPLQRRQVKENNTHARHKPRNQRPEPGISEGGQEQEADWNGDPNLRGAPPDFGVAVALIFELIARIFRIIFAAVEGRIRRVGEISAAADRLGEQGRHLDAAIERLTAESPQLTIVGPTATPPAAEPAEFLRVVKKPVRPAQLPGLKPIPTPNAQNLGGPEPQ